MTRKTTLFRQLIEDDEVPIQPGAYDGFSGRLIQQMGFKSGSISGACLVETTLGWADVGLLRYEENLSCSRNINACGEIPLKNHRTANRRRTGRCQPTSPTDVKHDRAHGRQSVHERHRGIRLGAAV
jgi:hypothetical protein